MKKILYLSAILLAVVMIYGYKQARQNVMAENNVKRSVPYDLKGINNSEVRKSADDREYYTPEDSQEGIPEILLILTNDKSKAGGSSSLFNNLYVNHGKTGC